jgi:hypothetical protein
MFLRIVKAAGGAGTTSEYVRLVESYREGNKTKQRVVFNLGRRDILAEHLMMRRLSPLRFPRACTSPALAFSISRSNLCARTSASR